MAKQTVTRRQKDVSRMIREKEQLRKDLIEKKPPSLLKNMSKGRKDPGTEEKALFTGSDRRQIREEGLTVSRIKTQIERFRSGVPYIQLNRPSRVGDGIDVIPPAQQALLLSLHDEAAAQGRFLKFVPASGAASRMFMDWYRAMDEGRMDSAQVGADFAAELGKYAFVGDLADVVSRSGRQLEDLLAGKRYIDILSFILTASGLDYGQLPKALIKFHAYPSGNRTAIEEHLVEAALYVKDAQKISRLHVTVSAEHRTLVRECLRRVRNDYERKFDIAFDIGISIQKTSTNTIAVDLENQPFRREDGRLYFRPGGHGALLENLNALDGDIIFLKNIDNIVPDRLKGPTVLHKKILGGYLVLLQREIFAGLGLLAQDGVDDRALTRITDFCSETLHIVFPPGFDGLARKEKVQLLFRKLNRPIRVCGMVKNEGEPGGGPFWVNEEDGAQSLQIIESMQVDLNTESQKEIWRAATHFNPVDLVCGVRDYRGEKFNLLRFVNPQTAAITGKTEKGRDLKALEHPGLWNGSMADWNTVFVEVPLITFNPVKTVGDLLRPTHQPDH